MPLSPFAIALTYAIVVPLVVALAFAIFQTKYALTDLILAAIVGAAASLLPTIGAFASLIATIGLLYWRLGKDALFPDIVVSVFVARLVTVPVLFLLQHR
jgi:hypothetical protein